MRNHDDKYPSRPGFEPGTFRLQVPVDTNEPSGPATRETHTHFNQKISALSKIVIIPTLWIPHSTLPIWDLVVL